MRILVLLFLPGLLGGCGAIAGAMVTSAMTGAAAGSVFYAPPAPARVMCSTPDSITVEYYTDHDAALALVAEHREETYTVTQNAERGVWHAVDARCNRADSAAPAEPPCVYRFTDPAGFGEGGVAAPEP